jgi:DNA-binding IclR family transcriptional regulator
MAQKPVQPEATGTIERTLRAIRCVAERGEFSLKDFAEEVGIPTSTAYRLLQSLGEANFIEKSTYGSYRVGRELYRLSALVVHDIEYEAMARPLLQRLSEQFHETCALAIYLPKEKVFTIVETVGALHQLQYVVERYTHRPMVWGALGRSMLPFLPEEDVVAAIAKQGRAPEPNMQPITREDLRAEAEAIMREGCFVATSPNAFGTSGTAAPVFNSKGQVFGSIGVTIPSVRYDPEIQPVLSAAIIDAARGMSAALGYRERQRDRAS